MAYGRSSIAKPQQSTSHTLSEGRGLRSEAPSRFAVTTTCESGQGPVSFCLCEEQNVHSHFWVGSSAHEVSALVMMDAFLAGDSFGFPDDCATVRDEQATGNVFRRFSAAMKLRSLACWNKISPPLGPQLQRMVGVLPKGQVAWASLAT